MEQAGDMQEEIILVARFQDSFKQKYHFLSQWNKLLWRLGCSSALLGKIKPVCAPFEACCTVLDPAQNESMSH